MYLALFFETEDAGEAEACNDNLSILQDAGQTTDGLQPGWYASRIALRGKTAVDAALEPVPLK